MLQALRIRQLVLVEDQSLDFEPGLTLLTGETGAGKSILVDALGLIAGSRGDRDLVRKGARAAIVEASFALDENSPVLEWAADRGLDDIGEDRQLVIRREIRAEGAGNIRLNGSPCTLGMLRELGGCLLELHGQHEQQSLLSTERQREVIDRFGGHTPLLAAVAVAFGDLQQARRNLAELRERSSERLKQAAELRADIEAIEVVAPEPGETERLDAERSIQAHGVKLGELLESALGAAQEGEPSAVSLAVAAERATADIATIDPSLAALAAQIASARVELEDAASMLRDYQAGLRCEPGRLDEIESRRARLRDLLLRFGETEQDVLDHADRVRAELAELDGIDDAVDAAQATCERAEAAYAAAAAKLSRARRTAGRKLIPRVEGELRELALEKARFGIAWTPLTGGKGVSLQGVESVEFQLAANPGEDLRPLRKVASGGELSRVMLALHAVLGDAAAGRVLVFDEVDAGVGGSVADAIGSRLAALARRQQVLCVTHLPQVAAYADGHLRIHKGDRDGRTYAAVEPLDRGSRVEELARMLAGRTPTSVSRRHARELLDAAAGRSRRRQP